MKIVEPIKKEKGAYVKATKSDINRFLFKNDDENRFYKIQVQQGSEQNSFIVPLKCLRVDDIEAISDAEYAYWFGHKQTNPEQRYSFTYYLTTKEGPESTSRAGVSE